MDLRKLLQDVKDGSTNIDDALSSLKNLPYEDIGYANIDHHREIRIDTQKLFTVKERVMNTYWEL